MCARRFGKPEPTEVSLLPKEGKCILVTGHDLYDLEQVGPRGNDCWSGLLGPLHSGWAIASQRLGRLCRNLPCWAALSMAWLHTRWPADAACVQVLKATEGTGINVYTHGGWWHGACTLPHGCTAPDAALPGTGSPLIAAPPVGLGALHVQARCCPRTATRVRQEAWHCVGGVGRHKWNPGSAHVLQG